MSSNKTKENLTNPLEPEKKRKARTRTKNMKTDEKKALEEISATLDKKNNIDQASIQQIEFKQQSIDDLATIQDTNDTKFENQAIQKSNEPQINNDNKKEVNNEIYLDTTISSQLIKTTKTINKDIDLKILGKMLYNKKNYYCELECKLFDTSYYEKYKKEEISDIDVYGVFFDNTLQINKIGFECKSTLNNGVDEILKIKGIQAYNDLNTVGLLKKKVANNVRLIADKIDVQVYDEQEINKLVSMLIEDYKIRMDEEKQFYIIGHRIEEQLKIVIKGVIGFIKASNWTNKPHQNIHTIIRALEHIRDNKQINDYQYMYVSIKLSILLSLSFLEICSNIVKTNLSNMEQAALDQLFGGTTERWEKSRTYDLISQEMSKKISPYPYYTNEYLNIISWIISNINDAGKIPLCLEEYLKCYLLNIEYSSLNSKFSDETLKLTKDILRFVSKILKKDGLFQTIYKI